MHLEASFCITCKNRLEHLLTTLEENCMVATRIGHVEFVILDYSSKVPIIPELAARFKSAVSSELMRMFRYEKGEHFVHAHAKNIAHRLARGDVLVNLDADNILSAEYVHYLLTHANSIKEGRVVMPAENVGGTVGRIAISNENFVRLDGYREDLRYGWGYEDVDFINRARLAGLLIEKLPSKKYGIRAIQHDNRLRSKNCFIKNKIESRLMNRQMVTLMSSLYNEKAGEQLSREEEVTDQEGRRIILK